MFISQVNLSRFTLEPHVNQLVTITVALADSTMIMQLCRYSRQTKKTFAVHIIIDHASNTQATGTTHR